MECVVVSQAIICDDNPLEEVGVIQKPAISEVGALMRCKDTNSRHTRMQPTQDVSAAYR